MHFGELLAVKPDKPEKILLDFRDIPLKRFDNYPVTGGNIDTAF
jgi:hypothetical protein